MTHIAIPIDVIVSVLDSMYYNFSPFLDDQNLTELNSVGLLN